MEQNMDTGMLWFDNDPRTDLKTKILKASKYYQNKYGVDPNLCFVHPTMLAEQMKKVNAIEIRSSKKVLPYHLWLGISPGKLIAV
jgi:hypothetical protein